MNQKAVYKQNRGVTNYYENLVSKARTNLFHWG